MTQAEDANTHKKDSQSDASPMPMLIFSDRDLAPALEEARINLENLQKDMDNLKERLDRLDEDQEHIRKLKLDLDAQVESESNVALAPPSALANFRLSWQDFFANYDHGAWDHGFSSGSSTRFWNKRRLGTPNRAQKRSHYRRRRRNSRLNSSRDSLAPESHSSTSLPT
ncbi:hypothetical protein SCHPADRAFT_910976 [Schizopora paradoxa]|uniref:Uncharacterized protein n=1 Tax=Schizopora paradoxa TaxID=27342 RepID=A0A0H2R165_9AGAM|nr:hypothetical protein SCHPADRAFT_910976 [Schizopora paradoxa]